MNRKLTCRHCRKRMSYINFYEDESKMTGYSSWCKHCIEIEGLTYVKDPRKMRNAYNNTWKGKRDYKKVRREKYAELRKSLFEMYGNRCACCGEHTIEFLSLEHRNGQRGYKIKEEGMKALVNAVKEFNPDKYEILCMNCNHAKGRLGYCPHHPPI